MMPPKSTTQPTLSALKERLPQSYHSLIEIPRAENAETPEQIWLNTRLFELSCEAHEAGHGATAALQTLNRLAEMAGEERLQLAKASLADIPPLARPTFRLMAKDARGTDCVVRHGFVLDLLDEAAAANSSSGAVSMLVPRTLLERRKLRVVDESGTEVTSSPALDALQRLLPVRYHSLIQRPASTPAEIWLNAHLYSLAIELEANSSATSKEAQMMAWLEAMTPAERLDFAQRHIRDLGSMETPTYRLRARDQSNGREYLMQYGFLVDLLREARQENARNKDYWVTDHAGIEIDSTGQPVEEREVVSDAAGEQPGP
jgi:hypothetical protein